MQDCGIFLRKYSGNVKATLQLCSSSPFWIIKQQQAPARQAHTFWKGVVPMSISAGVNVGRTLVFSFSFSWTIEIWCLTGNPEAKMWDSCCQTSIRVKFWFFWYLLFRVLLFVCLKNDWASTPKLAVILEILENAHYGAIFQAFRQYLKVFWFNR